MIGRRIHEARVYCNVTAKEMASYLGCSVKTLRALESGKVDASQSADLVVGIIDYLALDPTYIIGKRASSKSRIVAVPLATDFKSGFYGFDDFVFEEYIDVLLNKVPFDGQYFLIEMPDKSMEPMIPEGALVLIDRMDGPLDKDLVLVSSDEFAPFTVRQFIDLGYSDEHEDQLYSLKDAAGRYVNDLLESDFDTQIQGRVVRIIHEF